MAGRRQHDSGGIHALQHTLDNYLGAVERDLLQAGYSFTDVGTRLTLSQFVHFVVYSPPGTAVYHKIHEGWSVTDHLLAQVLDSVRQQVWMHSMDALKPPELQEFRPQATPRPGVVYRPAVREPDGLTVNDYLQLIGEEV